MKHTIDAFIQQGNTWFLAGAPTRAFHSYIQALQKAGALPSVLRYIQTHTDNLSEDQDLLEDLLRTKYHLHLHHDALPILLANLKKHLDKTEDEHAYPRFKAQILSKHPTTPTQYIDVLLDEYEQETWREIRFLSDLLQEHGYQYDICDISDLCYQRRHTRQLKQFEQSLHKPTTALFSDINTMTGSEFEDFLVTLFHHLGYYVKQSKRSHEQGLDLLLQYQGETIACQAKRLKSAVGNRAVQQVIAAREHYHCNKGLVVTNSRFTTPAKQLAERCHIDLWDGKKLKEKITAVM